jgi:hypothetical protein
VSNITKRSTPNAIPAAFPIPGSAAKNRSSIPQVGLPRDARKAFSSSKRARCQYFSTGNHQPQSILIVDIDQYISSAAGTTHQ